MPVVKLQICRPFNLSLVLRSLFDRFYDQDILLFYPFSREVDTAGDPAAPDRRLQSCLQRAPLWLFESVAGQTV